MKDDHGAMSVKRYDFGTEYRGNTGVPGIVGKIEGRYVLYDDYRALELHNDYLLARLRKQDRKLEAIGAGGVSAQRISGK